MPSYVEKPPLKQTEPPLVDVIEAAIREREFVEAGTQPLDTQVKPPEQAETEELVRAFAHPDSQRRFHAIASAEELERALAFPWDKWTIFTHPEQRQLSPSSVA